MGKRKPGWEGLPAYETQYASGGGIAGFAPHIMGPHLMGGPHMMKPPHMTIPGLGHAAARPGLAMGGMGVSPSEAEPWWTRQDARGETDAVHPGGLIASPTAGRADHVPTNVLPDSYILPADIVAGMGQHNTLAGAASLDKLMQSLPYGVQPARFHGRGEPIPHPEAHPPQMPHLSIGGGAGAFDNEGGVPGFAEGRVPHGRGNTIPVRLSGGEYNVLPRYVWAIGRGNMDRGHRILDAFVIKKRDEFKREIAKLPPPKRD